MTTRISICWIRFIITGSLSLLHTGICKELAAEMSSTDTFPWNLCASYYLDVIHCSGQEDTPFNHFPCVAYFAQLEFDLLTQVWVWTSVDLFIDTGLEHSSFMQILVGPVHVVNQHCSTHWTSVDLLTGQRETQTRSRIEENRIHFSFSNDLNFLPGYLHL